MINFRIVDAYIFLHLFIKDLKIFMQIVFNEKNNIKI